MPLSRKQRHDLITLAAHLLPVLNDARAIAESSGLDISTITLSGSAHDAWSAIVRTAEMTDRLANVIDLLIERFDRVNELKEFRAILAQNSIQQIITLLRTAIQQRQAVLFLGPDFLRCAIEGENLSFNKHLSRELSARLRAEHIYYEEGEDENLSYIIDRFETRKYFIAGETEKKAKEIFDDSDISENFFREITRHEFPLIINTNPDPILQERFPGNLQSGYYDMSNDTESIQAPFIPGVPIVYNIFGSFENPLSILFSEKEAVEFTKKAYQRDPPIPDAIRDIIENKFGIFIGFNFKDWHFKILFDVLNLTDKPGNYAFSDTTSIIQEHNLEYYERLYNMTFIKNNVFEIFRMLR